MIFIYIHLNLSFTRSNDIWKVREDIFHFASEGDVLRVSEAIKNGFDVDLKVCHRVSFYALFMMILH